jgi:anthrone oxygenase-like protein
MTDVVTLVAILSCALFAGAAIYINLVEHPARLSCGTEIAARQWAPSYKRATVMQASLAVLAGIAGVIRWLQSGHSMWLCGAVAILAVVPVTLLVIFPTNERLLDPGRDLASEETRILLVAWGRLHAIRSVLSFLASILFIWAATHD